MAPERTSQLSAVVKRLEILNERIGSTRRRITSCADELVGPVPRPAAEANGIDPAAKLPTMMQIERQLDAAMNQIDSVNLEFDRLTQL
jgi:hypothetical protein